MHIWTVICRGSSIDVESNNVSLFSAMEQIVVPPAANGQVLPIEFEIVSLFQRDDPDTGQLDEMALVLVDPMGNEGPRNSVQVNMVNHQRARIRLRSPVFRIDGAGTYWFEIRGEDDEAVARVPLMILFQDVDLPEEEGQPQDRAIDASEEE